MRKNYSGIPNVDVIESEPDCAKYKSRCRSALKVTAFTLAVIVTISILIAAICLPFLKIYGNSMSPTLNAGEMLCCIKTSNFKLGDIVAFYYNDKILVKRVIGLPGDTVNIDKDGNVYINNELLNEPYLTEKSAGESDISMPYQVPNGKIFVLGDHRSTSVDSRHSAVGCIAKEQIIAKLLIRIWPIGRITIFDWER